ncbi:methyltransferase-like protein 24 isoform X2 [Gouania willdenowi]|uniref:methyltransferase-like protein 24 isoform X2 n=1 Tax=Gouania willdenowi TaxID=441366 RepID=UPI0010556CD4|nr:methyltransferase-like protein 24 isoform X2 [Gouania willdenowi]
MRTCWGRGGGLSLRSGILLLLVPPLLLALQQLVLVGSRLPGPEARGPGGDPAFTVISIEPVEKSRLWGNRALRFGLQAEEDEEERRKDGERKQRGGLYQDETELRQKEPRVLKVQPWATDKPSFTAELTRLITYITTAQLNCSRVFTPGQAQAEQHPAAAAAEHWLLCAEDPMPPAEEGPCVAYSFRLGCEVHSFDLTNSNASGGHPGDSLDGNHGDRRGVVTRHKMWLEWRAQKKRKHKTGGHLSAVSHTLADIMAALGHQSVHFLYADLLSAEWRVFHSLIEEDTLHHIHHLVAKVHLQWAGFEVGGTNEEVLRYWFSVLRGLQTSGLKLVHSSAGEGHTVLKQTVGHAHSSYTLSWVNTQY